MSTLAVRPALPQDEIFLYELYSAVRAPEFALAPISATQKEHLMRMQFRGQITTMGMLLDPLADKIMVTAAFVALVAYNPEVVKVWIVVVIIGREFLISGLRSIAASEGFTVKMCIRDSQKNGPFSSG